MLALTRQKMKENRAPDGSDTLYRQIERAIFSEIQAGKLQPGDCLGTSQSLAARWKVSPSTIRQSLQMLASRGIVIRKPRVGTIVAPGIGEAPSLEPSKAHQGSSRMICVLLPDITHPEFARLSRTIQDEAHKAGMDVIIGSTDDEIGRYEEIILRQVRSDVFGMVLVPPIRDNLSLPVLNEIKSRNIPVVTVFRDISVAGWPYVFTDYFHNNYLAAKHLCGIGCNKIAFFAFEELSDMLHVKHYAFLRALISAGKPVSDDMFLQIPLQPLRESPEVSVEIDKRIRNWLIAHPEVDGINCAHDEIAFAAMRILHELGRNVPRDVAVVGEGNFGPNLGVDPKVLTTVDARFQDVAAQIFRWLNAMREGEIIPKGTKVAVPGELIVGHSTLR